MSQENRLVLSAYRFAHERHRGQTYGDKSYAEGHLLPVAQVLYKLFSGRENIGFDFWLSMNELPERERQVLAAAFLHDVVEDTSTSLSEVKRKFGERVAKIVDLVTVCELSEESGRPVHLERREDGGPFHPKTRKQKLIDWGRKWAKARDTADLELSSVLHDTRLVKLADRLCNVEACWRAADSRLFMYRDEHPAFEQTLLKGAEPTPWLDRLSAQICVLLDVPRFEPSSWKA